MSAIAGLWQSLFACLLCLIITNSFADSPPKRVGAFTRSDGVIVKAMQWETGSFLGYPGTNCWFEFPDGKQVQIANAPGKSRDSLELGCVLRITNNSADIYRFKSDRFPVANRVLRFDGYTFKDVTTPDKRWLSPLIHTWDHIWGYLIPTALLSALALWLYSLGKTGRQARTKAGMVEGSQGAFLYASNLQLRAFVTVNRDGMEQPDFAICLPDFHGNRILSV